ncbi:FtsX-like permease family protein [Glaciihabitans arcticus]|uniref:FtsX-like permease family protein n=1 Tax=Glaciihabitans arcticus TaxID=2668039 RepID=A0A4Q9GUZ1_9MICO|nr:FtsX-like permease family protein [Glaciihabitans arcticus]TBN55990.1 FtsX-like permease family protein [Glaciihabitans arcticus]
MRSRSRTGWLGLSARGAVSHSGLLGALGALVFGVALLLAGLGGYLAVSATSAATSTLDSVGDSQRSFTIQARRADDPATQRTAADAVIGLGLDRAAIEVTVEDRSEGGQDYVRWTIVPHPTGFTAAAIPGIIERVDDLQRAFGDDPAIGAGGVTVDGSLTTTLNDIQRRIGAEQGASLVPLALIGIIGLVALGQVARLLAGARGPELGLIRSRGATLRRLGLGAALEALAVALPAALLGTGTVLLAFTLVYPAIAVNPSLWIVPLATALATAGIVAASTVSTARTASLSAPAFGSRGRTAIGAVSIVLVLVIAGVSFLQFRVYGSPLVVTDSGQTRVEPFIAAAPALLLLASVVVGLALFAPLVRLAELSTARGRGARPSLPLRQVARRVGLHAVSVTVVALAIGSMLLATGYSGTLARVSGLPPALRAGGDLRVVGDGLPSLDELADAPSVTAVAPVLATSAQLGGDSAELVAIPAARIAEVMNDLDGSLDTARISELLAADPGGIGLGSNELEATLTVDVGAEIEADFPEAERGPATITVTLVTLDESGTVTTSTLDPIEAPAPDASATVTRIVELPAGEHRLLTIGVSVGPDRVVRRHTVTLDALTGVPELALTEWGAEFGTEEELPAEYLPAVATTGVGVEFTGYNFLSSVRLIAPGVGVGTGVPVVASEAVATRLSLEVGDTVSLRSPLLGEAFDVVIVGTVPAVPGTTNALGFVADLATATAALSATPDSEGTAASNQYWLASDDPAATAAALNLGDAAEVTVATPGDDAPTSTTIALWLGALGALLLAAATVYSGNVMVSRARRGELRVLHALGMTRREIGAARRLEVGVVVLFGVLLGGASGYLAALLTISDLARSATLGLPLSLPVPLLFDLMPLAILAGAALVVLSAVAAVAGTSATRGPVTR